MRRWIGVRVVFTLTAGTLLSCVPVFGVCQSAQATEKRARHTPLEVDCGVTPLMRAAFGGELDAVVALLEAGADPTALQICPRAFGSNRQPLDNPIQLAASRGHAKVVLELVGAGAEPRDALPWAIENGDDVVLAVVLSSGARLSKGLRDAYSESGCTPLTLAVMKGRPDWTQRLLEDGADVNQLNSGDCTAYATIRGTTYGAFSEELLAFASRIGLVHDREGDELIVRQDGVEPDDPYDEVVRQLEENAIRGGTALAWAAALGDLESVLLLLRASADAHIANESSKPPVDWASLKPHSEVLAALSQFRSAGD